MIGTNAGALCVATGGFPDGSPNVPLLSLPTAGDAGAGAMLGPVQVGRVRFPGRRGGGFFRTRVFRAQGMGGWIALCSFVSSVSVRGGRRLLWALIRTGLACRGRIGRLGRQDDTGK
jgi:hypothetical protein